MKILCIGDSNTYGFDPRSYIGVRYPEEVRWTGLIKGHSVINFGINGITIPEDHEVYADLIRRKDPDLVIVMLGTNDILEGASAEKTAARMSSFIDSIKAAGKPILLIAPPVLETGDWVADEVLIEESKKVGELYRGIADSRGCRFADAGEWGIELVFDGVHFSPAGHEQFAEKLEEQL